MLHHREPESPVLWMRFGNHAWVAFDGQIMEAIAVLQRDDSFRWGLAFRGDAGEQWLGTYTVEDALRVADRLVGGGWWMSTENLAPDSGS